MTDVNAPTDVSRLVVDRAHREEMDAARAEIESAVRMRNLWMETAREQVEQVNSWRDVYDGKVNELTDEVERIEHLRERAEVTADEFYSETLSLRIAVDLLTAERDESRREYASLRNRCTLLSEGNRRLTAQVADLTGERDRARDLAVRVGAFDDAVFRQGSES